MLYHHYIGHDNNRDWYMFTQVEIEGGRAAALSRVVPADRLQPSSEQSVPRPHLGPPMKNPVNPNLDPLIVSTINQIGEHMRKRFDEEEKPGYNSNIQFDMWWNGSMRGAPDFHNMAGLPDRDGALSLRHAEVLHGRRSAGHVRRASRQHAGEDAEHELHESVARRLLAAAAAGGVHADGVARDARSRRRS